MKATYTWILAGTLSLLMSAGHGSAAEPQKGTSSGAVQSHKLSCTQLGDALIQFHAPEGWKPVVETSGGTKMSFYSPDPSSVLTILIQPDHFDKGTLLAEKARTIVAKRYATAKVGTESSWTLGRKPGCRIDFERKVLPSDKPTKTRFAMARIAEGLVEIWFTTPKDQFPGRVDVCESFLQSLHSVEPAMVADLSSTEASSN